MKKEFNQRRENAILIKTFFIFNSIEDQHVQFKVEPNNLDIDASQIANTLGNDINIQKRLTDNLGVDISKVAAGDKVSSSFPIDVELNKVFQS